MGPGAGGVPSGAAPLLPIQAVCDPAGDGPDVPPGFLEAMLADAEITLQRHTRSLLFLRD